MREACDPRTTMARLVGKDSDVVLEVGAGKTLLGRGPLLKVMDKRVSRSHAVLEWGNGVLRICPKHSNPCFLRPDGRSEFRALVRDAWVELHHGNEISLLPDSLRYTVELEGREREGREREGRELEGRELEGREREGREREGREREGRELEGREREGREREGREREGRELEGREREGREREGRELEGREREGREREGREREGREREGRELEGRELEGREREGGQQEQQDNKIGLEKGGEGSEKEMEKGEEAGLDRDKKVEINKQETSSETAGGGGGSEVPATSTGRTRVLPSWLTQSSSPAPSSRRTGSSPSQHGKTRKTTVSSGKAPVKRLSPSPEQEDKEEERQLTSLTAAQCAAAAATRVPPSVGSVRASPEPGETPLPPCPYGAACYRKNPAHIREYSHSSGDDRPHCPYGSDCYRKNPEHRKQFQHSGVPAEGPAAAKRTRQTQTKRNAKRVSVLAGESDDSEGPNTYDYKDSFIDDNGMSSGSTSYGGESEGSDWAPPTEGGGGGEEEEEVGDLVTEAKDFISNQKMWQP